MPLKRARINELLARMNTEPLRRPDSATVALVVFNPALLPAPPCRVRFAATFPIRAPKPVTIRDDLGNVTPSRIVSETVEAGSVGLPEDKVLWSLVLEFALIDGLAPRSARAFAASYEETSTNELLWKALPLRTDIAVYETTCHLGELPASFSLPADF